MREAFIFVLMNQLFHLCNFLWFLEQVVVLFWDVQTLSFVPAIFLACVPKSDLWGGTLCQAKALLQTAHVCCQTWCNLQVKLQNPLVAWISPSLALDWSLCILSPFPAFKRFLPSPHMSSSSVVVALSESWILFPPAPTLGLVMLTQPRVSGCLVVKTISK